MKSLSELSQKISEKDYHSFPAYSYSMIAEYARKGFQALATLRNAKPQTDAMKFGSLLDCILTRGKDALEEEFIITDCLPTPAKATLMNYLATVCGLDFNSIPEKTILQAMDDCQYQTKWKPQTRIDSISDCEQYYEALAKGKNMVSSQDYSDAMQMAGIIKNDSYLKGIFGDKNTKDTEYLYQMKFILDTDINGSRIKIKFMPDVIVVHHDTKQIQLVDLKTSAIPAYNFARHWMDMRYDIQAHLYSDMMKQLIRKNSEYAGYQIMPYLFVDISRSDKVPVTFIYDQNDESQLEGLCVTINDKLYKYKSWKVLLKEIIEYEQRPVQVPSWINPAGPNDIISLIQLTTI